MKRLIARSIAGALLLTALVMPLSPALAEDAAPRYTFETINFPGSGNTWIWGMNDRSDVVGFYRDPPPSPLGIAHGFSRIDGY
jgi:hypothetical protein